MLCGAHVLLQPITLHIHTLVSGMHLEGKTHLPFYFISGSADKWFFRCNAPVLPVLWFSPSTFSFPLLVFTSQLTAVFYYVAMERILEHLGVLSSIASNCPVGCWHFFHVPRHTARILWDLPCCPVPSQEYWDGIDACEWGIADRFGISNVSMDIQWQSWTCVARIHTCPPFQSHTCIRGGR